MVTIDTVKDEPTLGELGKASVPESIQLQDTLMHVPDIDPEKMHNMFKTDGQVVGLWRMLTTPIRSSNIRVMRPVTRIGAPNNRANREYNFISELFIEDKMRTPMATVLSTALRMLIDGWSPHEIVWVIEDGLVNVDKVAYRQPKTITVKVNKNGEIENYLQKTGMDAGVNIPTDKVLHFVFGSEWNPIFGRSMFLQAFYHYEKKHKLYYIAHIAAQINALRLRLLRSEGTKTKEEIDKVVAAVSRLGFNSTINMPQGYELDFPDIGNNDMDLLPLIQHHDVQMSKAVLSQVIDIGVEGQTGSFNLSDTHLDIFIINLELIAHYISRVFNKGVIPKLIDWNFGTGLYPKIEFLPFDREDRKFIANLFTRIAASRNVNVTPEFRLEMEKNISEMLNFDIDYDAISDREIGRVTQMLDRESDKLRSEINRNDSQAEAATQVPENGAVSD